MGTNLIRFYLFAGPVLAAALFVMGGLLRHRKLSFDDVVSEGVIPTLFIMVGFASATGWDRHHSLMSGLAYAAFAAAFETFWLLTILFLIAEPLGRKQLLKKGQRPI